jgi:hypothetical protein
MVNINHFSIFYFIFLLILINIPLSSATFINQPDENITEALNVSFIESVSELPEPTNLKYDIIWSPDTDWWLDRCEGDSTTDCIRGYIKIIGFRNSIKIGDTYYINSSPEQAAITTQDSYIRINTRHLFWSWNRQVDVYPQGEYTIARLTATATIFGIDFTGFQFFDNVTSYFYDTVPTPNQYSFDNYPEMYMEKYIGNYNSTQLFIGNVSELIISYTVHSENGSYTQYLKSGHVNYTENNVPYMELSSINYFNTTGSGIYKSHDGIISNSNVSYIRFRTPFYSYNISCDTIPVKIMKSSSFDFNVLSFIIISFIFIKGSYEIIKTSIK